MGQGAVCKGARERASLHELCSSQDQVVESPDVHFEPIVKLAPVEVRTMEENEMEVFKMLGP